MINVTKTYLPDFDEYTRILKRAWDKSWITNNGELVLELQEKLKKFLGVHHLWFTSNGTVVLQIALKALEITGEVITTPFSYVATTNAILWEGCKPVFADISPKDCCVDVSKIEPLITEQTQAILLTHVYGLPCDVDAIQKIADKYHLKVIYDGAHAFGCTYKGKSLLSFGDISTCSFHATKIFHTVEGGCIVCHDEKLAETLFLYRQFGHFYDDYKTVGINAKNSEFHAAMGLCVLPHVNNLIARRKVIYQLYDQSLNLEKIDKLSISNYLVYNYSYYPVVFKSEEILLKVMQALAIHDISGRRYFYPSLNCLPFLKQTNVCTVSESVSERVLTLPLYFDLSDADVLRISGIINEAVYH